MKAIRVEDNVFSWNGWYFGYRKCKNFTKHYKSKNVRFDDIGNSTFEIDENEYHENAIKWAKVFHPQDFR